jgi:death-on-curing protein
VVKQWGSHGVRDHHGVATLEELPRQAAFGKELYPTVYLKAALYIRNIITAHPFIDGNKRTAMTTADVFLTLNGYRINVREGRVETFALRAISEELPLNNIAK